MLRALKAIGPFCFLTLGLLRASVAGLVLYQMRSASGRLWLDVAIGFAFCAVGLFFLRNVSAKRALLTLGESAAVAAGLQVFSLGSDYFKDIPNHRFQGLHGFRSDSYVFLERSGKAGQWAIHAKRFKDYTQKEVIADRMITEPQFEGAEYAADDIPLRVQLKGRDNCIDAYGKPYFDWKYDQIVECRSENKPVIVKSGGVYSLVKMDGSHVRDLQFDEIQYSSDFTSPQYVTHLFRARRGTKWGFIERSNAEEIIKPQYEEVRLMRSGQAEVKLGGLWGVINSSGRFVVYPQFQGALLFSSGGLFETAEGLWALEKDAWGLYDMVDKRWIIAPQLSYPGMFASMPGREHLLIQKVQAVWTFNGDPISPTDRWESVGQGGWVRRKPR